MVEKHPSSNMLHEESCSWTFICTFTCSFTCNFTCIMRQVEAAIQSVEKLLKDYGHPPLPRKVIEVFLRQANIFQSLKCMYFRHKYVSDWRFLLSQLCSDDALIWAGKYNVYIKGSILPLIEGDIVGIRNIKESFANNSVFATKEGKIFQAEFCLCGSKHRLSDPQYFLLFVFCVEKYLVRKINDFTLRKEQVMSVLPCDIVFVSDF